MNNKILARVVAVVMAVAMLGTVSFAALSNTTGVTPPVTDGLNAQTTRTVLAVKAASATEYPTLSGIADADILDVQQFTGTADTEYSVTLNIDETRLGETRYVAVFFGGNNGVVGKTIIDAKPVDNTVLKRIGVFKSIELGENTYSDVVGATYTYTNETDADVKITSYGITLAKYADPTTTTPDSGTDITFKGSIPSGGSTTVEPEGSLTFTGFVYGVDAETSKDVSAHVEIKFE